MCISTFLPRICTLCLLLTQSQIKILSLFTWKKCYTKKCVVMSIFLNSITNQTIQTSIELCEKVKALNYVPNKCNLISR